MLTEFSVERGTSCIPAWSPVIVLCIITLAIHESLNIETNLDLVQTKQI